MAEPERRDGTAFEATFERHWEHVYRLCFAYMKERAEAEDTASDVFVRIREQGAPAPDEEKERKALTAAAVLQCRERLRSRARRYAGSAEDDMMPGPEAPAPEKDAGLPEKFSALPSRVKDAVILRAFEGCGTEEIASLLGRPPATVGRQLKDAEELLGIGLGDDALDGEGKAPIREAVSRIEAEDGAKERILAGIREKEADRKPAGEVAPAEPAGGKESRAGRILRWAAPAAAVLLLAGIGIAFLPGVLKAKDPRASESVQLPNPLVPAKDAEEIREKLGIVIRVPEGAEDIEYRVIDGRIADVQFVFRSVPYTLRASEEDGDFSGIYAEEVGTENIDAETDATLTTYRSGDETYRTLAWKDGGIRYILAVFEGGSAEELIGAYQAVRQR